MICRHVFEDARAGHDIAWDVVVWEGRLNPRKEFTRDDDTTGTYSFSVSCPACIVLPHDEVAYVEEFFQSGQLHVADYCR